MENVNKETYSIAKAMLIENGIKSGKKKNPNIYQNFVDKKLSTQVFKALFNFSSLDITLRNSTIKSNTITEVIQIPKGGINVKIIREYKIYDEFKKPYDIINGKPYSGETGNPYAMSSGYHRDVIFEMNYKNKTEALKKFKGE